MSVLEQVWEHLDHFAQQNQEINGTFVAMLDAPPTALEFLRMVHQGRPVLIKNAVKDWPAMQKWTNAYFRRVMGKETITVACTPDGRADAVKVDDKTGKRYFCTPFERQMTFDAFLDILEDSGTDPQSLVHYVSLQNGSMTSEFYSLMPDIVREVDWCSEALGSSPDAVNFWFGDERSVTTMHKDPYENCYAVLRGQKTFVLIPPTEAMYLHEQAFPPATYEQDPVHNHTLRLKPLEDSEPVPWIELDPTNPDLSRFPQFSKAKPLTVTVQQGDMLYLPAMWFHQVHQQGEDGVIAVNYWYDIDYQNPLYTTFPNTTSSDPRTKTATLTTVDGQDEYQDCLPCRLVGATALTGLGAYAWLEARKVRRLPGRTGTVAALGLTGAVAFGAGIYRLTM
ncbi:hypothetical protein BZG36_02891 [Bifiguratus adelaidae]|uniref:JmjC domain-containing protein n=1 Tax=Bifiguratus adelaidae TaxID=1938954 RepID=A0A261Y2D1_9FUNG|nr:hypothetical protein BZG36_02891 [Bifiguratus adelaidae]